MKLRYIEDIIFIQATRLEDAKQQSTFKVFFVLFSIFKVTEDCFCISTIPCDLFWCTVLIRAGEGVVLAYCIIKSWRGSVSKFKF